MCICTLQVLVQVDYLIQYSIGERSGVGTPENTAPTMFCQICGKPDFIKLPLMGLLFKT